MLLVVLVFLLIAGAVGYGAYDFLQQKEQWEQTTTADLSGVGEDLSVSVASMRKAGYEVTAADLSAWLQDPQGYGSDISLRVVSSDADGFSVAGYRTWQDHLAMRSHVTRVCGSVKLVAGIKTPVTLTEAVCPDSTPRSAPVASPTPAKGGELAAPAEQARLQRSKGAASDALLALAGPTKPVGDLHHESVSLMCAAGTTDIGTSDGYLEGHRIPIRLCAVNDLPSTSETSTKGSAFFIKGAEGHAIVNARVSGAIAALVATAKKHGLHLSANSSFRSMAQQQDTCRKDLTGGCSKGDYTFVAQPGYSNHQAGAAVDFDGTSVPGKDVCDSTRAKDPTSRVWKFLNRQALAFGFKQYAPESWHWDVMGGADRCAPL